jgi:hypothetical protein
LSFAKTASDSLGDDPCFHSCQTIFLERCGSCCRAIVAKWYCPSPKPRPAAKPPMASCADAGWEAWTVAAEPFPFLQRGARGEEDRGLGAHPASRARSEGGTRRSERPLSEEEGSSLRGFPRVDSFSKSLLKYLTFFPPEKADLRKKSRPALRVRFSGNVSFHGVGQ